MREEYIAQLEAYAADLPEKLRARMHLERLRGNAALNAVVKPFQSWGLSFEKGAAEKLMGELAEIRVAEGQNFREARGEFVEPVPTAGGLPVSLGESSGELEERQHRRAARRRRYHGRIRGTLGRRERRPGSIL